ncbi:MAG: tetratricopeptide repeat protein, partial [Planctomycetota bacterium]|nr:tetratricopeptide repeat protein [Planctomycetota bacterium]
MSPSRAGRRSSRISRLWYVVGAGALFLLVAGVSVGVWLRWEREGAMRQTGLAAAQRGESVQAVQSLGHALRSNSDDAEGWAEYARVREQVLAPDQGHLSQALTSWRRAVDLDPSSAAHWRAYARLAAGAGDWQSTIRAGKKAWELDSSDAEAAHLWASALLATRNAPEAQLVLEKGLEQHPDDWRLLSDQVLVEKGEGRSTVAIADALRSRLERDNPDARWRGVLALEARIATGKEAAVPLFRAAAESAPEDADYLRWLIPGLDEAGLSELVLPLLARQTTAISDPRLELLFARRAWEGGRPELIVEKLKSRQPVLATDPELAALRTLAKRSVEGDDVARKEVERLSGTSQQTTGEALWIPALKAVVFSDTCNPAAGVEAIEDALRVTGSAPVLHFALAECWMRMEEYRLAAQAANRCSRFAPLWLGPRSLETAAYIRAGLSDEAYGAAFRAFSLEPESPDAALAFGTAWLMVAEPGAWDGPGTLVGLREWLAMIHEKVPANRRDAVDVLRIQTHLRLGDFPAAAALIEQIEKSRISLLAGGAEIKLLRAEYDRLSRAAENPDGEEAPRVDSNVKSPIVAPPTTARDDSQSVPSAIRWRLIRARELLTTDTSEKTAAEAATLVRPVIEQIPKHPDAHLLAGLALARLQDRRKASEHFLQAIEGDWRRGTDAMRLALACRTEGNWNDAGELVRMWVSATRLSERLATERRFQLKDGKEGQNGGIEDPAKMNDSVVLRLLVLAELSDLEQDFELSEAAYRELLRIDPDEHVAL